MSSSPPRLQANDEESRIGGSTSDRPSLSIDTSILQRPNPNRSYSLTVPTRQATATSTGGQTPLLPLPATAPGPSFNNLRSPSSPFSPNGQQRRERAHTVAVSLRRPRGSSITSHQQQQQQQQQQRQQLQMHQEDEEAEERQESQTPRRSRRASSAAKKSENTEGRRRRSSSVREPVDFDIGGGDGLHDEAVGLLDCIDPQVSTVNHLQNISNTLVFPHLPALWSRRPEVVLPETPESNDDDTAPLTASQPTTAGSQSTTRRRATSGGRARSGTVSRLFPPTPTIQSSDRPWTETNSGAGKFAAIPENSPPPSPTPQTGDGQLEEELAEIEKDDQLDGHVRHVLKNKSKKETAKKVLSGLWTYVKTPMGFVVAIYGFLIVFWGAAIVLFLLGWIPTNSDDTRKLWIEISSQIENGLFTITSVGLIPWRVTDSFRMFVVWRLKRKITSRRKAQGLPPIEDPNDIPDPKEHADYVSVLTADEQRQLLLHQEKFQQSQTWYKPHATATHTAFPISLALLNTMLTNGNSIFQCVLCGCMWGLNRFERPAWTTGIFMPMAFLCGIGSGVVIWLGSKRTKKTVSVEERLRQALGVQMAIGGIPPTTKEGPKSLHGITPATVSEEDERATRSSSNNSTRSDEKERSTANEWAASEGEVNARQRDFAPSSPVGTRDPHFQTQDIEMKPR